VRRGEKGHGQGAGCVFGGLWSLWREANKGREKGILTQQSERGREALGRPSYGGSSASVSVRLLILMAAVDIVVVVVVVVVDEGYCSDGLRRW
jgi:hypothetical protein